MYNVALSNGMFTDLEKDEMFIIDGGGLWKALVLTAGCVITGIAPVVGIAAGIGASMLATPVLGVAGGVAAGAGMAAVGTSIIDYGVNYLN